MARGVHDPRSLVPFLSLLALAASGCILPPSLSTGNEDAGVNSPPAILAVRTGAVDVFDASTIPLTRPTSDTISFELLDTDVQDTLHVRIFVDYTIEDPTPDRTGCTAPPTGSPRRTVTCTASGICQEGDSSAGKLNLTTVVFDREPLESGDPRYQAVPTGGLSTSRFFFLVCTERP